MASIVSLCDSLNNSRKVIFLIIRKRRATGVRKYPRSVCKSDCLRPEGEGVPMVKSSWCVYESSREANTDSKIMNRVTPSDLASAFRADAKERGKTNFSICPRKLCCEGRW